MTFNTIIMKDMLRFTKEEGLYTKFKKQLKRISIQSNIKTEEDLFNNYNMNVAILPYLLFIEKYNTEDEYLNSFNHYLYKHNKNNFINFFENFLKQENIKEKFFNYANFEFIERTARYIKDSTGFKKYNDKKNLIYNNLTPLAFIMNAFQWDDTKEGQNYWTNIHYKWVNSLKKYIIKGNYKN
jgi:hypothetical protein